MSLSVGGRRSLNIDQPTKYYRLDKLDILNTSVLNIDLLSRSRYHITDCHSNDKADQSVRNRKDKIY